MHWKIEINEVDGSDFFSSLVEKPIIIVFSNDFIFAFK